jgi:hypothetical protein
MKKNDLMGCSLLLAASLTAQSQTPYPDHAALTQRLRSLTTQHKTLSSLQSIGKTATGKDIWVLALSKGDAKNKPALAIVANVDGAHLAGTELALQLSERLLARAGTDSIGRILDSKTIYVIPSVNPEAAAQYFAKLKMERTGNGTATDDDRDGQTDEDGPDDLNGDGLITMMRVEDPTGTYLTAKADPRVLLRADPTKGETGRYRLLTEGTDADKDGEFNEDGPGGISLNRNFTFDYEPFKPGTGEFPVSEPETRALLDFLYNAKNVYAVLTFGPANNLSEAPKFDRAKATRRVVAGWLEKDVAVNEQVSKLYNQAGLTGGPNLPFQRGDFPQWAYYHYGRLSFATPGWWVPKDTARRATPEPEDVRFMKWATANNVPAFVDWKPVQHPDFPGKTVEVGGFVPFAKLNPPVALLAKAVDQHVTFVTNLALLMPQIELVNLKTETVGPGLTRVTVDLHNRGLLPSHSELGTRSRFVDRLKVAVGTNEKQQVVSGRKIQLLREPLAGNGTVSMEWLISGTGSTTIEVGSAMIGTQKITVPLAK